MKKFYITPNTGKPGVEEAADKLKKLIREKGGDSVVTYTLREGDGTYRFTLDMPEETDCVITLGGDGTIIQAAGKLAKYGKPVIGINMGTLGFLAETDMEHADEVLDQLFRDEFYVEERMMVHGEVYRNGKMIYENSGVNDIVLHAYGNTRAVNFEFILDDEHLKDYFADGMIIATPTGSTAYNLSAGGPIMVPSGEMMVATPINPHSLISRSIVLSGESEIRLRLNGKEEETASVNIDSAFFSGLRKDDEIVIRKSDEKVKFIKLKKDSFVEVLRQKLEN